ncbi:copper resistance protein NlpE N-terminal domain-containing protein [Allopusillimonas ginsengisoli]|uniref:copper resistance protein NlpE N-terminal domain-containing protein n=1 Tax=Allopusillimonas ginsengisoli TaxID=453575 RepID=UPI0014317D12|nr:copper resistance protein NlpE N-terminal domain-containing protein [Allopusillimonas ginsengisoli]
MFKPGASSGHIAGSIQQRQYCDYRFRARAGQQLKLSYADSQRPQVFLVAPIERQMLSDDEYILPDSGVYDLRVMLTRNDARKYAKLQSYAITVSIVDVDPAVAASALEVARLAGLYEGTAPCDDCAGIETTLMLYEDGSYTHSTIYTAHEPEKVIQDFGSWQVDDGLVVLRSEANAGFRRFYKPAGNALVPTDSQGRQRTRPTDVLLQRRSS